MSGQGFQVGKGFTIPLAVVSANPSNAGSASATTGGSLSNGTYYLQYAFVTSNGGMTAASPEYSISLSGSNNAINYTVAGSVWPSGATACNVYIGTASGKEAYFGQITAVGGTILVTSIPTSGAPSPQYNTTSFQDINPSAIGLTSSNEFIIQNLYYNNPIAFGTWDGTTLVMFDGDTANGARENVRHRCNATQWIRVYNQSSNSTLQVSFDGVQSQ